MGLVADCYPLAFVVSVGDNFVSMLWWSFAVKYVMTLPDSQLHLTLNHHKDNVAIACNVPSCVLRSYLDAQVIIHHELLSCQRSCVFDCDCLAFVISSSSTLMASAVMMTLILRATLQTCIPHRVSR